MLSLYRRLNAICPVCPVFPAMSRILPIPTLNVPDGMAYSNTDMAEIISNSLRWVELVDLQPLVMNLQLVEPDSLRFQFTLELHQINHNLWVCCFGHLSVKLGFRKFKLFKTPYCVWFLKSSVWRERHHSCRSQYQVYILSNQKTCTKFLQR